MRRQFNNAVSVAHSAIRFGLLKLFHGKNISMGGIERFSPNVVLEMTKGAKVRLGRSLRVHSGCKIKVRRNAELSIGDGAKLNYSCIIACHDRIGIGAGTEFGPSVYVYDHDHDFRAGLKENRFKSAPVQIGENCWIGAHTVILRGTTIGNNCVIGAGSVVSGTIPDNTLFIQKRENTLKAYEAEE